MKDNYNIKFSSDVQPKHSLTRTDAICRSCELTKRRTHSQTHCQF